ncbi:unnamed protein product [Pleuronectes platessa]|uniref:Uncharacterized protein n=1 Tax=Pleuronectes platessa TaxID=8262 RepID=A0A9N7VNR2_PLEPL|nr:unnamed protein product [Pleuronectes platessa]
MRRRGRERERGERGKEGSLMWAVNPATLQQPSLSSSIPPSRKSIPALSIPPISCDGSAKGKQTRWGVCSGLTGRTERPVTSTGDTSSMFTHHLPSVCKPVDQVYSVEWTT